MAIIGIDLGTTNSLVSVWKDDGPELIKNALGDVLTPSVVSLDNDLIVVGAAAKNRLITHPFDTVAHFKRKMGTQSAIKLGKQSFKPEELSSFVLRQLKQDAESFLGEPVTEAVISVPAYFNDIQRKATKLAGELAGLKVERIINEPTAAAIAYGVHDKKEESNFLIVDLGGGTFDVSVLEKFDDIMEVHATAGDNYLGGEDFTQIFIKTFIQQNDLDWKALNAKEQSLITKQIEQIKVKSYGPNGIHGKVNIRDHSYQFILDNDSIQRVCKELIDRIRAPIERAIRDSNLSVSELDDVILVGGATRMPLVKHVISKMFRRLPSCHINPDEVVALGTATQGALKERNQALKDVVLTDVCPYTLGVEIAIERDRNNHDAGYFLPIIERNVTIPVSKSETLQTVSKNQHQIVCKVFQGESRLVKNNLLLGAIEVDVPKKPAGEETVEIRYTYDINGILEVDIKVESTGEMISKIINHSNTALTEDEIKQSFKRLQEIKIHPRDQQVNVALLAHSERLYEESLGDQRQYIAELMAWFDRVLASQNLTEIEEARTELKARLEELEQQVF
jgi:molecular chaperone HscC